MFIPLPSSTVCDYGSQTSISIAQMVSRTWENFEFGSRNQIPELITFRPDGSGSISVSHDILSSTGHRAEAYTHEFSWSLARHGPLGMEDMNYGTLFNTFPKLARSTNAWTFRTWEEGMVPAYIHLDLVGSCSFEGEPFPAMADPFVPSMDAVRLPVELLDDIFELAAESSDDTIAMTMSGTCRRARELCLRKRRRESFRNLARLFGKYGMAMWMTCGHYNSQPQQSPTDLYGIRAAFLKYPDACGYPRPDRDDNDWRKDWSPHRFYYSCKLPLPIKDNTPFWNRMLGETSHDAHPEVHKRWT